MITPGNVIAALWLVWLLGWLLAAAWTASTVAEQSVGARLAHSVFIWAGAALLFMRGDYGILLGAIIPRASWISWLGVALVAAGLGFAGWARMHLGRLWSGSVTLREGHAIVQTGPYGMARHPIYTGLLLALIGTVLTHGTVAALAGFLLILVGVILKIRQEESLMLEHFGADYQAYRRNVPALIPRLPGP